MERVREITECCICSDPYTDPRILSCIHTFCLKCLAETAEKTELKSGDAMPCPMCRKSFVIPTEGMTGLQKNFFMESLLDISKLLGSSNNVVLCDVCRADAEEDESIEIPPAVKFCIECRQNICDRCCRDHKRFRNLQNHELVDVGNRLKDEIVRKTSLQFCAQHDKEEVKLFCTDCKETICMMCFVQKHKFHNCSGIDEVAEEHRKQIKCDTERMRGFVDEVTAKIQQIVSAQTNFQENMEKVETEIFQRGAELKELVDKCTKSLLDELILVRRRVTKENNFKREESERHKIVIQSFETYCMELSRRGSSADICRAANDVHLRAEELETAHQKHILEEISSIEIKFKKSSMEAFLKEGNIVGNIREPAYLDELHDEDNKEKDDGNDDSSDDDSGNDEDDDDNEDDDEDDSNERAIRRVEVRRPDFVFGVCKLENKIYILLKNFQKPNSIRIYDGQEPFNFMSEMELKEIDDLGAWSCSERSRCLYILDNSDCIWKMTTEDHKLTKWIIGVHDILSVTLEDHLLVLREEQQPSSIDIYGSDATLIRSLQLPSDILEPRAVIQNSNGEFIILHRLSDTENGPWVISRLTLDGQTVICRSDPNKKSQEMKQPFSLALDSENDRLFVNDAESDKINLFDSNSLTFIQVALAGEEDRCDPLFLWYDRENKELFVTWSTGHVYIYVFDFY